MRTRVYLPSLVRLSVPLACLFFVGGCQRYVEIHEDAGAPPTAPVGLSAAGGYLQASLSWDALDNASSYDVLRGQNAGGPYVPAGSSTTNAFTDVNVNPGWTYVYVVRAVNPSGVSGNSNEASAAIDPCPLPGAGLRVAPNGRVNAIAQVGCTFYVGGEFDAVGPITAHGALVDRSTGRLASGFANLPINGAVNLVVADGSGGWYVAGDFTRIGASDRNGLAHLAADGSLDADWDPHPVGGGVRALAVSGDREVVYVGGGFTGIGGLSRLAVAALHGAGMPDAGQALAGWNASVNSGEVSSLALVEGAQRLYLGGTFYVPESDDSPAGQNYLAALGTDDGMLQDWHPSTAGQTINAVAVKADGTRVYAGGGVPQGCNPSGYVYLKGFAADSGAQTWNGVYGWSWVSGCGCYGGITALAMGSDGLYAIGGYHSCNDHYSGGLVKFVPSQENPEELVNGRSLGVRQEIRSLAVDGTDVYVGGEFTSVYYTPPGGEASSTIERKYLVRMSADGTLLDWDAHAGGPVDALAAAGSALYAGGRFAAIGGTPRRHLAAIESVGVLAAWQSDADRPVWALAARGSTLYVGGEFQRIGSASRNHLAALGTDGTVQGWDPATNDAVYTLAVGESAVYAGGKFTSIMTGGDTSTTRDQHYIAAIGTNGQLPEWSGSVDGVVRTLALGGATLYAGGDFTRANGMERAAAAAFGADAQPSGWNPGADGAVRALLLSGSTVYLGGDFQSLSNLPRARMAAVGTDAVIRSWSPAADQSVYALATNRDGSIVYVGGGFVAITIGSGATVERRALAAVGADGALRDWDPDADGTVHALAVGLDGLTVYAGGSFTTLAGIPYPHLVPLDPTTGMVQ